MSYPNPSMNVLDELMRYEDANDMAASPLNFNALDASAFEQEVDAVNNTKKMYMPLQSGGRTLVKEELFRLPGIETAERFVTNVGKDVANNVMNTVMDVEDFLRDKGLDIPFFRVEEGGIRYAPASERRADLARAKEQGLPRPNFNLQATEGAGAIEQAVQPMASFIGTMLLTPGGLIPKTASAAFTMNPELGNLSTFLKELGINNEVINFLDSKVDAQADAEQRLIARVKNLAEEGIISGALEATLVPSLVVAKQLMQQFGGQRLPDLAANAQARIDERSASSTLYSGVDPTPLIDEAIVAANKVIGERRVGTTGQYVGAPPGIDSPEKMTTLRQSVFDLAEQGAQGRMWYERSGKAILDAVGGNVEEADKLIQAIAITSPGTPVKANFDYALQAYSQYKAGKPILTGRFPTAMGKKLEEVFAGKEWAGRKTDDFYNNLMTHIDPSRVGPVTGDIWMLRAFGFDKANEMPSPRQYEFMTLETQKIAKKLGWQPHQVQASIWVATKARDEGLDLSKAAFDYSDALQGNLAQISWESIPGATGKHMPEMFSAPYEQQAEYHVSISKVFLDDNGSDIIANRLGIPSPGDFEAPGYFEGKVSPGTQTELAVPRKYKGAPYGEIEPAALDLMNAYAAIRGVTMKQDGVGYHRPFFNPKKKDVNGMLLDIGRPFTEQETDLLAKKLAELSGHTDYNPIGSREGVRIINFDPSFDNKAFVKIVKDALGTVDIDANLKIGYFNSQNGYLGNDWSVNKNGEDYIRGVSERGSSDLYRKVRTIIEEIQPRVDEIDADFAERYGWSVNAELNAGYRPGAKPEVTE